MVVNNPTFPGYAALTGNISEYEAEIISMALTHTQFDVGHDWLHLKRVRDMAIKCAESTNQPFDQDVIIAAAWMHDIVNVPKDHPDRSNASTMSADLADELIRKSQKISMSDEQIHKVRDAIKSHSFSAGFTPTTIEGECIRDADRLDSLGVIGFMRMVAVSTSMNRALVSAADPVCQHRNPDDRKYAIDHYFTKIMHLNKGMTTPFGKATADARRAEMDKMMDALRMELTFPGTSDLEVISYPIGV